jgi:hypothetical protein
MLAKALKRCRKQKGYFSPKTALNTLFSTFKAVFRYFLEQHEAKILWASQGKNGWKGLLKLP